MLSQMSSGNPPKPLQKAAPTFRRARAETLPSRSGGAPISFKTLRGNAASSSSLNSGLSSNSSTPFRSRLSSFTLSGPPDSSSFSSKLSWEDPLQTSSPQQKLSSINTHYEVAAAKTLDFLGLNDDSSPLPLQSLDESEELGAKLPGLSRSDNGDSNSYGATNRLSLVGNSSDSDSDHTAHSPRSRASVVFEGGSQLLESLCLKIENLSLDTTLSKLTNEVSQFGDVESVQLIKKEGTGFVTFSTLEEAKRAQVSMNEKPFLDSLLKVKFHQDVSNADVSSETGKCNSAVNTGAQTGGTPAEQSQGQFGAVRTASPDATSSIYNKTKEYYNLQADSFKAAAAEIASRGSQKHELLMSFEYAVTLPPIPNPNFKRKVEPTRLRELRKQLETEPSLEVITAAFNESKDCWVDLCSDYIGNIIIQKLIEYGSEDQKTALILSVAPYMAAIGIHKNGTWAIQKMIECATTEEQIAPIAASLKPFTPALLLDQFGNYVVQCCLKFEYPYNQFIFDSIYSRCSEIAQGRYGARAIRTCLDSQYTIPAQKDLVSEALMRSAFPLSTNANGSLLLNWILDSQHTEHYMGIVVNLNSHLAQLCCHKLASSIIVRLINQQQDMQAREFLIYRLFFQNSPGPVLNEVLTDHTQGNQFVQKVLNSPYLGEELKSAIQIAINSCGSANLESQQHLGYRRLLFEDVPVYGVNHSLPPQQQQHPILDSNFAPFVGQNVSDMGGNWPWSWGSHSVGNTPYYSGPISHSPSSMGGNSYFAPMPAPITYQPTFSSGDSRSRQAPSPHIALNTN